MKKKVETAYGVIGLGRFGEALAMMLAQSGHEVIAVDKDEKKVKEMRQYTDCAFVADNLSSDTLKEIGIQNCDVVIICIGEKVDVSVCDRDGSAACDCKSAESGTGSGAEQARSRGCISGEGYGSETWEETVVQ